MDSRARNRRVVVWAVAFAAVFTIVAAVLGFVWRGGDDDEVVPAPDAVSVARPGDPAPAHALWMFGFDTLRVDVDDDGAVSRLDRPAFGAVAGTDGRVFLYDPNEGRVGVIDASTNTLRELAGVPPVGSGVDTSLPALAVDGERLWLVSGPGRVRPYDVADETAGPEVDVAAAADLEPSGATGVVTTGDGVVVAYEGRDGVGWGRLDGADGAPDPSGLVDTPGGGLRAVAGGDGGAWLFGAEGATSVATAGPARTVRTGSVAAATEADGRLWLLPWTGPAQLRAVDPDTSEVVSRVALFDGDLPPVAGQRQLVAARDRVWALVPTGRGQGGREVRVVEVDPAAATVSDGWDIGAEVFVGAIAVS